MKMLGLMRHAKSGFDDSGTRDFDRGLNERGCRGARLMGQHIRKHGVKWDRLLASPAQRVKQTLHHALPDLEPQFDKRLYLASSDTVLEVLREYAGDAETVLLAGHNPGLHEVLFAMVPPSRENDLFGEAATKFPTASFAALTLDIDDWADLAPGCGRLTHFARPRDLDPDLGPEF
ncbi:histidine phosphatase family protein [Altererythrobacter sp. SALINAS58]|uniref:SixA phosphatase family protein n=1 Tax=Alteripontixanthobacter muriae TaxID=2705546 RepID=UPI001575B869|nr:histidine phosphatase family protein [Alteripontixanthobacter muriae]NTZ42473.1 histidine phosphatase family protein [Alteripontixanthobacter muriae]